MKNIYAQINKVEPQDDGTIKVYGYASTPDVDSAGETVTADAMRAALPDYMKFGAVREMHQPSAAGTAIKAEVDEDGRTIFGAHVVDPVAVKKVQSKVYKGFSIGGKVISRDSKDNNIITELKLVEVSLVDRPCNPEAVFTMYKAEETTPKHTQEELDAIEQLSSLVNKGAIVPSKLVELAQSFIKGEMEMDDIKKSFWEIADLARLLGQLKSIATCMAFNAACEGELSPASVKLKASITDLTGILVDMIGEEVAEMSEEDHVIDPTVEMSAKTGDMAKGKKKVEGETDDKPEGEEEDDSEDDTSKEDDVEESDDAEEKDEPKKTKKAKSNGDLAKMLDGVRSIVTEAVEPLNKRIAELEAQPAPSKAVLKVVGKGQDVNKADNADEDGPPAGSTPEQVAAWEIKKIHAGGRG
jgi:phage head maturation protease